MRTSFAIVVLLCLTSIEALSQDQVYYWSSGKQNFLEIDKTSLLAIPDKETDSTKLMSNIKSASNNLQISESASRKGLLIQSKEDIDLGSIKKNHKVKFLSYGFKTNKEDPPMFLNGEILLQPKANYDIEDVLNLIDGRYVSFKTRKYGIYKIAIADQDNTYTLANQIYESGMVNYCHPNFIAPIRRNQMIPTDPLFGDQYYLNQTNNIDINAPQAWAVSTGINVVRVAVIDDGVEAHDDLGGRVVAGFTPTDPNGLGAPAYPTWPVSIFPFSPAGHGQACAGIIGATHNNVGVAGVFPNAEIVPVNIFNDWFIATNPFTGEQSVSYNENIDDIREAIDWAWDDGQADVLSNSWGFVNQGANFDEITFAIDRARTQGRGDLGSVVIFASGNEHSSFTGVTFPANVNGVITVGAISRNGGIHGYSSRGAEMDLVAPSGPNNGDLVTIDRMGALGYNNGTNPNYTFTFNGTSAACPQVAGVAALMLSINPNLSETQLKTILQNTATDMGSIGFDNTFGYGRVNAFAAVKASLPVLSGTSTLCASNNTYTLQNLPIGTSVSWSVSPTNLFGVDTGSGSSFTTRAENNYYSGEGVITATISGSCGSVSVTKNIWVGNPAVRGGGSLQVVANTYYGPSPFPCVSNTAAANYWEIAETDRYKINGFQSYVWKDPSSNLYYGTFLSYGRYGAYFVPGLNAGGAAILEVTNACGTSVVAGAGWSKCYGGYSYSVSPNPSSGMINIAMVENERILAQKEEALPQRLMVQESPDTKSLTETRRIIAVRISDKMGNVVRTINNPNISKEFSLDVRSLSDDLYYLEIYDGKNWESHKVILRK